MHLFLIFFLFLQAPPSSLTGQIKTSDGQPVAGAVVVTQKYFPNGGFSEVKATTSEDGRFSILPGGKVLFVRKDGFVPLAHTLQPNQTQIDITLELLSREKTFFVPDCFETYGLTWKTAYNEKLRPKHIEFHGLGHIYPVPRSVLVERYRDEDFVTDFVIYPRRTKYKMVIHGGGLWGANYPRPDFFENLAEFSERALSTGEIGEEIRATLKNGHKSRWVGGMTSDAFYYNVTPQAAAFFDSIIDHGCKLH